MGGYLPVKIEEGGVIAAYNVYQYINNELPVLGCSEDN